MTTWRRAIFRVVKAVRVSIASSMPLFIIVLLTSSFLLAIHPSLFAGNAGRGQFFLSVAHQEYVNKNRDSNRQHNSVSTNTLMSRGWQIFQKFRDQMETPGFKPQKKVATSQKCFTALLRSVMMSADPSDHVINWKTSTSLRLQGRRQIMPGL